MAKKNRRVRGNFNFQDHGEYSNHEKILIFSEASELLQLSKNVIFQILHNVKIFLKKDYQSQDC